VTLIGWSLGGIFARETAKLEPESVRSVISMGSPVSGATDLTNAGDLFKSLNGSPSDRNSDRFERLGDAPPVPTTSIFSKTDGIVAWEASIQADRYETENIIVPASHLGLGFNPLVMYVLADRLRQAEGNWQPFDKSGLKSLVFAEPDQSCLGRLKSVMGQTVSA
jgi:pimeloyl-ACP methyl ester carboxylesterase